MFSSLAKRVLFSRSVSIYGLFLRKKDLSIKSHKSLLRANVPI